MRRLARCRHCRRYIDKRATACPFCRADAELSALGPSHRAVAHTLYGVLVLGTLGGCGPGAAPVPSMPVDTDRDGIADDLDRCLDRPEDVDRFEDDDGCPDLDHDGDGILNADDRCLAEAEDLDGFEDDDGCPDLDDDGDGVPDLDDQCLAEAEDRDGFEDDDGCPDLDNDGDGIADVDDQCPNEAETYDGITDLDGCSEPSRRIAIYGSPRLEIREFVPFAAGSAKIPRSSDDTLDDIASVLHDNPRIGLSIEGHADAGERRRAARRDALSEKRAEAVRDALVERGIESERFEAVGHGDLHPLESSDTEDGRARNRRVEFVIRWID